MCLCVCERERDGKKDREKNHACVCLCLCVTEKGIEMEKGGTKREKGRDSLWYYLPKRMNLPI